MRKTLPSTPWQKLRLSRFSGRPASCFSSFQVMSFKDSSRDSNANPRRSLNVLAQTPCTSESPNRLSGNPCSTSSRSITWRRHLRSSSVSGIPSSTSRSSSQMNAECSESFSRGSPRIACSTLSLA
ncbi:hypothetical protein D3C78_1648690 [compost metagenome]